MGDILLFDPMNIALGHAKTQRPNPQPPQDARNPSDHNHNFTHTLLKQQVFYKPPYDPSQRKSQHPHNTSLERRQLQRHPLGQGMGDSFVSSSSYKDVRTVRKEEDSLRKMVINLSHELLVKDSIIADLESELMNTKTNQTADSKETKHNLQGDLYSRTKQRHRSERAIEESEERLRMEEMEAQALFLRQKNENMSLALKDLKIKSHQHSNKIIEADQRRSKDQKYIDSLTKQLSVAKKGSSDQLLTKRVEDLEGKQEVFVGKITELQKLNCTLKTNLESEKNSYATLSLHYKHEKDESTRKLSLMEKEIHKLRAKLQENRVEENKLREVMLVREESLKIVRQEIERQEREQAQCQHLIQELRESVKRERGELQILAHIHEKCDQKIQEMEENSFVQEARESALVENIDSVQAENGELKKLVDSLTTKIQCIEEQLEGKDQMLATNWNEEINKKLGQKVRTLEQELASSKHREEELKTCQLTVSDFNAVIDSNKELNYGIQKREEVIHELREGLRRQEDSTISLKLILDDNTKKMSINTELLQMANRSIIDSEIRFGNKQLQTVEIIDHLKAHNEELEEELRSIYEKLEQVESRLEENEDGSEDDSQSQSSEEEMCEEDEDQQHEDEDPEPPEPLTEPGLHII